MEKAFYRYIADSLSRQRPTILATVIFRSGSAPREAGATMAIFENGENMGTVGGGPLEAQVLAAAQKVITQQRSICLIFSLTDHEDVKGGMICGGHVEVLVDFLKADDSLALSICEKVAVACEARQRAWLVRSIRQEDGDKTYVKTGLGVMVEDDTDKGSLDLTGHDFTSLKQARRPDEVTIVTVSGIRYLIQPVFPPGRVIVAGAGHVGRELAALCGMIGFPTIIIDDRPDFANRDRFPTALQIVIPQTSFENCLSGLSITCDDRIVIVTRGHEHDRSVLFQAIDSGAGYIGMIGSRKKRDAIYENLMKDGITVQELARVHCPIGLPIDARTPAEISVSIVAELISLRNKQR